MNTLLFESEGCEACHPVLTTRTAFDVSMAGTSLKRMFAEGKMGVHAWVRKRFRALCEVPALEMAKNIRGGLLLLNARALPHRDLLAELTQAAQAGEAWNYDDGDEPGAAWLPQPTDAEIQAIVKLGPEKWLKKQKLPARDLEHLKIWRHPHEILRHHLQHMGPDLALSARKNDRLSKGVYAQGKVCVHRSAVLDTSGGPILLEDSVEIRPFVCIRGPVMIGRGSRINEGAVLKDGVQIGRQCKIGGEVEACIIEDFSNKQHHGFLGHSWVGSWVNLGAGTCNSDLKNTYGPIQMMWDGQKVDTGMQFFGCILGDYVKTAINTSIYTGKIVGTGSHCYGIVTSNVAAFSNHAPSLGVINVFDREAMFRGAERMMARRQQPFDERHREILNHAFEKTSSQRIGMPTGDLRF